MTKWYVTVCVLDTVEVDAETREEAEVLGLALFDPTANEAEVHDAWEKEDE